MLFRSYTAGYSDRFLTKASFLNLQNINLGYTFSQNWVKKLSLESLRIYVSCENVYYWSKVNDVSADPAAE